MEAEWLKNSAWIRRLVEECEEPDDSQVCERCSHYETCDIVSDGDCPFYSPTATDTSSTETDWHSHG